MSGNRGVISERTKALAARAVEMRAAGKTAREIAATLGISRTYASSLYNDPDRSGDRARKDRYSLPCPQCGAPMTGSNGAEHPPERCARCAATDPPRTWTRERIIEEFQRFAATVGRPPTATDKTALAPSQAAHLSEERLAEATTIREHSQRLPTPTTVTAVFGSWPSAVQAAGFDASGTGEPTHRGKRRARPLSPLSRSIIHALQDGPATRAEISQRIGQPIHKPTLQILVGREILSRTRIGSRGGGWQYLYALSAASASLKEMETMSDNRWIIFRLYEQPLPRGESVTVFARRGEISAPTRDIALERVATEAGDDWYAVPARYLEPMTLAPVEKLTVVPREA